MRKLFERLKKQQFLRQHSASDFATVAAHFLAELNAIHSFREGNGRTQLTFLALLSEKAGHPLNFEKLDPDAMLSAMITSFNGDEKQLNALIQSLVI